MRLRHSELKDGGLGALAVGVLEEALGVVIQVVVLKAGSNRWSKQEWGMVHTSKAARQWQGHGSMTAWQQGA